MASLAAVISEVRMSQYLSTGKSSDFFFSPGQPRPQLRRSRSTFARNLGTRNFGAPGQPSPATSALPVNLARNLGAPGQPSPATSALPVNLRPQPRRSRPTSVNLRAPATSALPVNLRPQLRRSWSTFGRNFGAPGQPSAPATSATSLPALNLASNPRRSW